MKLLGRWAILALAFWIATVFLSGIKVHGGFWSYFWVALLFGLINTFIGSILKLLTLPAVLLTFGLFSFVINAAMLMLTSRWAPGSLLISFFSSIMTNAFLKARWL